MTIVSEVKVERLVAAKKGRRRLIKSRGVSDRSRLPQSDDAVGEGR